MKPQGAARRESAQVVALFAVALVAILAMVGVTLDGGMLYVQRRTAQNAADAAALAGARALQYAPATASPTIPYEICKYVVANNFGVTPTVAAYFVDASGAKVTGGDIPLPTNCSGTVTNLTPVNGDSGIHVDVTFGPYNTSVVGIVGIQQLSATGGATAQVWNQAIDASYIAPWAVCGPTAPTDTSGTLTSIINTTTNTILQSAITAHVHVILESAHMNSGASGWLPPPPACPDASGSSWKGKIDASGTVTPPISVGTSTGNGSVSAQCSSTGQPSNPSGPGQCFLWVPVTDANNTSGSAHVVILACMSVWQGGTGNDKWWGQLEYPTSCPTYAYKPTWTFGSPSNDTVIALTR